MKYHNETFQTIRMCVQTYFNLYGVMPSAQEMIDWIGDPYKDAIREYLNEVTTLKALKAA